MRDEGYFLSFWIEIEMVQFTGAGSGRRTFGVVIIHS